MSWNVRFSDVSRKILQIDLIQWRKSNSFLTKFMPLLRSAEPKRGYTEKAHGVDTETEQATARPQTTAWSNPAALHKPAQSEPLRRGDLLERCREIFWRLSFFCVWL